MLKKYRSPKSHLFASVLLMLLLAGELTAQFHRLTMEDGLSQSTIFAISQDKTGYLWFGTQDGLNKYDGYKFTHYKNQSSSTYELSDNNIIALLVDHRGTLWIGTEGGGLNCFDPALETFKHYRNDSANPGSVSSDYITSLFEDSKGTIWVGTEENGINRMGQSTGIFHRIHLTPSTPENSLPIEPAVTGILETEGGGIWISTDEGIFTLNSRGEILEYFSHDPSDPDSICDNRINALLRDKNGDIWAGTSNGLDRLELKSGIFTHFIHTPDDTRSLGHNHIKSLHQDSSGKLWIGTDGGGLDCLDPLTKTFTHFRNNNCDPRSISENSIYSLFEDRSGVLWIGTGSAGINKFSNKSKAFFSIEETPGNTGLLPNRVVWSIYQDSGGYLWVGTEHGIRRIDLGKNTDREYFLGDDRSATPDTSIIRSIVEDRTGYIWAGTDGEGLYRLNPVSGEVKSFRHTPSDPQSISSDRILILFYDQKGNLWIGTKGGGLNIKKAGKDIFSNFIHDSTDFKSLANNSIYSILEDSNGNIWIGTLAGLDLFDPDTGTFSHFKHDPHDKSTISDNGIGSIVEDSNGNIWVGTDRGLNLMRRDKSKITFTRYKQNEGLPNDFIYGILHDQNKRLWISTNHGLSRFDPETGNFRNFDKTDGLQGNEFNAGAYFKNKAGQMFFGGINGITYFSPEQIKENTFIPPVVLTALKKFNQQVKSPVSLTKIKNLSLSYRDNYLSFEFAALDFHAPEKNKYAYRMEGFDPGWNYIGNQRLATYTNLDPGTYIFRVKGSNNDDVWNDTGLAITVKIIPPFWMTIWFKGIVILSLLITLILIVRTKIGKIEKQKKKLELIVKERTSLLAETNEELQRIAREDGLTGIANHRTFQETLEKEWKRAQRDQTPITLIMIDIDFFKIYNDSNGHLAGDRCLSRVAHLVEQSVQRPGDLAARYGGDEFSVLLPQTDQNGARHVAQKIKLNAGITSIPFQHPAGFERITLSLGAATMLPTKSHYPAELVQAADRALYEAKRRGRNRIYFYEDIPPEEDTRKAN